MNKKIIKALSFSTLMEVYRELGEILSSDPFYNDEDSVLKNNRHSLDTYILNKYTEEEISNAIKEVFKRISVSCEFKKNNFLEKNKELEAWENIWNTPFESLLYALSGDLLWKTYSKLDPENNVQKNNFLKDRRSGYEPVVFTLAQKDTPNFFKILKEEGRE